MASQPEVVAVARAIIALAKTAKSLKSLADQVLSNNSAQSIDWNDIAPEFLDENGDLDGTDAAPAEISNAIGSLASYQTYWGNGHGGNFEKLTGPIV